MIRENKCTLKIKTMDRIKKTENLLIQCEKDLKTLKEIHKEIKKIELNRKKLDSYYSNEYPQDYDTYANKKESYRVLNQDSVWNVLTEQYDEKIKICKTIIKSI